MTRMAIAARTIHVSGLVQMLGTGTSRKSSMMPWLVFTRHGAARVAREKCATHLAMDEPRHPLRLRDDRCAPAERSDESPTAVSTPRDDTRCELPDRWCPLPSPRPTRHRAQG